MLKQLQFLMLMLFLSAFIPDKAFAQFPYSESFMNSTASGMNFGGSPAAYLTSGNPDPSGNGYLRLTTNGASQKGYAFNSNSFPASKGISVNFEYYTYGGNGADGICFFLFDAGVADGSFNVGSFGGGLGYTNVTSTGLSRAYLGIGLDEFGNFSDASAGGSGGTGRVANSVTIRGAYNDSRGAYYMLTTVPVQTNYGFAIGSSGSTRPTTGGTGYRKAYIDILPHAGGGTGFDITVKIQHDAVSSPVTVINNYYYNYASPANLKFGFAASTGGSNNYHEIRNTSVALPASAAVTAPTQTNQTITTCSNSTGSVNVSGGFSTTNSPNGAINTASVDLDPTTSGIQTTYTVASKGTFTSDANGNITFAPLNSTVTGTAFCSFTVADNYGATSNPATVTATINPLPTTASAGTNQTVNAAIPATATLNGNSPTFGTGSWSQISGPSTAAFANTALYNTGASNLSPGTYVFRWTITNSCGTSTSDVTVTVTGTQTITFAALPAKAYGDADFNAGATASSGLAVNYTSSNPAVATVSSVGLVHILTVGTTDITAAQPGNGSYSAATPVTQILTVNKASQTITFAALPASTYNDPDFNAGATASSGLAVTYVSSNPAVATVSSVGLVHILSAGNTTITASQAGNGSYNPATSVAQILTVNKATPIITFNALPAKTYGNADFNPNATSSNSTVPVTYASNNLSVATIVNGNIHIVGAGTAVITASQSGNNNYNAATPVQQTLTVNQAALTITADNQSKTYGNANPVLTVSYSGFVNGDTQASLTTPPMVSTTATTNSAVGAYSITASGATSANYTIAYVSGTFSIYPGIQTISFNVAPKTYGDPDFTLSASASSGLPVIYSSSNPAVATVDAQGNVHIVSAGIVTITASQPGNGNYIATTNINQQLTINKAALTITADNQTSTYGSAIPPLTVSYNGFVNGDTEASLTTPPTANTTATAASAVGTYPITVGGAVSSSYTITYQPGTFTVAPNNQTITFAAIPAKTYGDADFNLSASASSGSPVTYNSSDPTIATVDAAGKVHILSAGKTIITASQSGSSNYQAAADVQQTLTVNQAPLTLTADNETITYGSASPALTISYSGFVNGDTPAGLSTAPVISTTATATAAAGTYPITVAGAASANYAITYQAGTFTVLPSTQSITFPALTAKNYGDSDFNINTTSTNTSLPITYTSSNPAVATVDAAGKVHILSAGTAVITASQPASSNYQAAADVQQTLTVNPAALTITADNQTKAPGAANPALTITYSGFVNGDDATSLSTQPTVSTTASATSAAGVYAITVSGAASANYNITYVAGTFTVTNPTISSVSLAQATIFENQPAGTAAGTLSATSPDPNATYTYSLITGNGSTDNASFGIQGNKLVTAKSLDFEQKAIYSILVRATNQYGLYLDQIITINLSDVNEAPTLAAIANQQICSTTAAQTIALNGITPGPETAQSTTLSVSSNNPGLFSSLNISSVSAGTATLSYQLAGTGTAIVTVTVKDNGGTANGGTDSFSQTFTIKANELPVAMVNSDKGLQISKGETVTLTATGGGTYSWNTSPNIGGTSSSAVVKIRPSQTTTYQVTASNASGCSSTASITINVTDDYSLLRPANILTPNGDGKNDTWVVKNIDLYPNNTVSIFDKGGRLLNKVSHYNNDWDGTYNGSPLAEGTYYYVIDFGPGKGLIKGFITILRNR